MTACIGLSFGLYALLASDTRVSWGFPGSEVYDDSGVKLRRVRIGLVTGAGLVQLLDKVKEGLTADGLQDTNDFRRIVEVANKETRQEYAGWKQLEEWIRVTRWLLTYQTVIEDKPQVRLMLIEPDESLRRVTLGVITPINAVCLLPWESADRSDHLHRLVTEQLRPITDFDSPQEHFAYHRQVLLACMAELARTCKSVSAAMHIGIHTDSGQCEISDRIDLNPLIEENVESDSGEDGAS